MDKAREKLVLQIINLLSPVVAAAIIVISGVDNTSVFSDQGTKILSPAGFTFAIWGPIFVFQGLFYIYQARDLFKKPDEKIDMPYVHEVSIFFILSWVSTAFWYVLWGSGYTWPGVAAMFLYLITSLGAYLRLGVNRRDRSIREHLFVTVGWSMLTGWVTVAAIVNTSTALVLSGFETAPLGEVGWTIFVLAIALVIYLLVLFTRNDFVFAGVGVWALIGVLATLMTVTQPEVMLVTSLGLTILVVAMLGWFIFQVRKEKFSILSKIRS